MATATRNKPALQPAVVAEITSPIHGETTDRPTPTPKAITIRETAAAVKPPAKMAPHETVELMSYRSIEFSGVGGCAYECGNKRFRSALFRKHSAREAFSTQHRGERCYGKERSQ